MFGMSSTREEDTGPSEFHGAYNRENRGETPVQTLDRNWISLLQELRVVQTGVQLLTGFLLILPFQERFHRLPDYGKTVFMLTVVSAVAATILLVAPVAMHRLLFRRRAVAQLVAAAHRSAVAGLVFLGLAMTGVVVLVSEVVMGGAAAAVGGCVAVVAFVSMWVVVPLRMRPRAGTQNTDESYVDASKIKS